MNETSNRVVQKLWSYCHVLRDDGLSHQDYLEQLTLLLFLKMADERAAQTGQEQTIPQWYRWADLARPDMEGTKLEDHHRKTLQKLAGTGGMLGSGPFPPWGRGRRCWWQAAHAPPRRMQTSPPSSATLASLIDDQKIRESYVARKWHFGTERAAGTEDAPFVLLEFREWETPGYGYATLGASRGPLQHEIVISTTEPLPAYGAAIEAVARAAPALAPGLVIPHAIAGTPFTALVCLPVDSEGSFALGKAGAAPYVYQLAPLTVAEQALAEREPGRAIDLLRAAHAFTADRYRACLVDVPPPPPAARTEAALERRQARAALLALQANMLREHGPRRGTTGTTGKRPRGWVRLPAGLHLALLNAVEYTIRWALSPYVTHPAPVGYLFAELIYVTFATHPDAVRMIDRALDPRNLPRPAAGDPGREAASASRRVTEALAIALVRCHPNEREAAILARAQPAIVDALSTFDPADEIPLENHVWASVLPVMYAGLEDLSPPAVRGMPKVFQRVVEREAMLEYEPDPRPLLPRLEEIATRLATELVTAYAAGLRGQLRD